MINTPKNFDRPVIPEPKRRLSKFVLVVSLVVIVIAVTYFCLGSQQEIIVSRPISTNTSILNQQNLPKTCVDEDEGVPVITSFSSYSGKVGDVIEIGGCNFSGFEGDKNAWIENDQGVKGILYGESVSTSKLLRLTLKSPLCQNDNSYKGGDCEAFLELNPGIYKIYTSPWGKESNKVNFKVTK